MPKMRYFLVSQEREVRVWANTAIDAGQIANEAFAGVDEKDMAILKDNRGGVTSPVEERSLVIREDY